MSSSLRRRHRPQTTARNQRFLRADLNNVHVLFSRVGAALIVAFVLAHCSSTINEPPLNPYVDGPRLILQAVEMAADLAKSGAISKERAQEVLLQADEAERNLEAAHKHATEGDRVLEQGALQRSAEALKQLRTFLTERQ